MKVIDAVVTTITLIGGAAAAAFQRSKYDAQLGKETFEQYHKVILAHITKFKDDEDKIIWAGKEYNTFVRGILTSANRPAVKAAAIAAAEEWLNNV